MQDQTRVEYIPKNSKCVSLKPRSYTIVTKDLNRAKEKADELLKSDTEHFDLYKPIFHIERAHTI